MIDHPVTMLDVPDLPPAVADTRVRRAIDVLKRFLQSKRPSYLFYNAAGDNVTSSESGKAFSTRPIIPADFLEPGMIVRIRVWGRYYSVGTPSSLGLQFQVGPTVYLTKPLTAHTGSTGQAESFVIDIDLVVVSTGLAGTWLTEGLTTFQATGTTQTVQFLGPDPPVQGINTRIPQTIRLRPFWSPTGDVFVSMTVDRFMVEIWPPPDMAATQPNVTFALDSMIEASNTALNLHTMDVGYGWTNQAGGTLATIQGGTQRVKFDQNGTGGTSMIWTTPTGYQDGTFTYAVLFDAGAGVSDYGGILLRYVDNSNMTFVVVSRFVPGLVVYERVGGVDTPVASTNFTPALDTIYNLSVALSGTTVTATVNGGNRVQYNSLAINPTGTIHGLIFAGTTTASFQFGVGTFKGSYP